MLSGLRVIDSHTGGEPTRLVVEGLPDSLTCPTGGSVAERARAHGALFADLRGALCGEPRGSAVMVGAALVEPADPSCSLGLVFFNDVGLLGMCGHGTMGALVSLRWAGALGPGALRVETPVGVVGATLHADGRRVTVENVPSFRARTGVALEVPELGRVVHGDLAWGGNWFFLVSDHGLDVEHAAVEALLAAAQAIRQAVDRAGLRGDVALNGGLVDHVELVGPSGSADACVFVLCPGGQYDRSPCGTGTSAKLACLAADGRLAPGVVWRQRSIHGAVFEGSYQASEGAVLPRVTGEAWVTGELRLVQEPGDPFATGLR